ncbi:Late exocytosis, Golgi transport, partial [Rhizoctonia solani]
MATYTDRGEATYGGLLQQTYAAIAVGSVCLTLVECLRRIPRRRARGEVVRSEPFPVGDTRGLSSEDAKRISHLGSRENWITGYLYMARCWAVVPSPVQPKWPLMWIWQVLRTNDETFLRLSGVDATVYTRFLRACFYFAALHTCTTLLVILPIHYLLGYKDIKKSDINRGSVTTLIQGLPDEHADKILWVIWITFSWMLFLVWFVLGSLRYRAYAARHAPAPVMSRIGSPKKPASTVTALHPDSAAVTSFPADSSTTGTLFPLQPEPAPARIPTYSNGNGPDYSLRCRTVMMTNIPQNLRTPQMLRRYFGRYLPDGPAPESFDDDAKRRTKSWNKFKSAVRPVNAVRSPLDNKPKDKPKRSRVEGERPNLETPMADEFEIDPEQMEEVEARGRKLVETVVIAPKLSALAKLLKDQGKRVEELEEAHIHLAQTVMAAVATEMMTRRREEARKAKEGEIRRRERLRADAKSQQAHTSGSDGENGGGLLGAVRDRATRLRISVERFTLGRPDRSEVMDKLVHAIGPFVEESCRRDLQYGVMPWFSSTFGTVRAKVGSKLHSSEQGQAKSNGAEQNGQYSSNDANASVYRTIWDALYDMDPSDLRPFHPITRRRSILFTPLELIGILAPTGLPTIDLAFARIRSIQRRVEDTKSSPLPDASERRRDRESFYVDEQSEVRFSGEDADKPSTIEPASSAFITFRRWEDARRAVRTLAHRPGRPLTCLIVMAPQSTDLDWERLVKGKFAAQYERFVRDWLVGAAIWLFQIFWLFPISFITTLISIQSLEVAIPPLKEFFDKHARGRSLLSGLIPTLLVAGLGILIPVILFVIGRKAQTEVTFSGLHDGILIRYYKWLILNIVYVSRLSRSQITNIPSVISIFFCIGLSSFRTFLEAFKKEIPDPFQLVSSSFPAAAPFYAGWCTYLHLLPPTVLISYPPVILQTSLQNLMQFGLVLDTQSSTWDAYTHDIRGPQPVGYTFWLDLLLSGQRGVPQSVATSICTSVLRRFEETLSFTLCRRRSDRFLVGNGKMLTIRVMRYSMDGLALSHIVFLAFNLLNYNRARAGISGTLFGLTLFLKVLATREFRARYERLEDAESARLCGNEEPFLSSEERSSTEARREPNGAVSDEPMPLERLDKFHSPPDAMGPSTMSWNFPGLKSFGRGYHVNPIRSHTPRGHKAKSMSLSKVVSRTNSQADIMRPDSPTSVESTTGAAIQASSRLLAAPLGIVQQVGGHVGDIFVQAPGKLLDLVISKPSHDDDWGGANYLTRFQPTDLVTSGPKVHRWDDTPNGSASASYECPYYLEEGPKALWLPRDPSGPIDLDDTIFMHRLLLSVHDRNTHKNKDKSFVDKSQDAKPSSPGSDISLSSIVRPPVREHNSEKSIGQIPFTQSPAGTPDENPAQATSYSTRAARPSLIRVRTASADRVTLGSIWGMRQSVSESVEMKTLQTVPDEPATTSSLGGTLSQPRIQRQPSLLSALRFGRGGEDTDTAKPGSLFSYKTAADGGESRQNSDKRKTRILAPEDLRKALDATVLAEEEAERAQKAREEQAEKLDDARVEQEESGGWSLVKKLVLKRNAE